MKELTLYMGSMTEGAKQAFLAIVRISEARFQFDLKHDVPFNETTKSNDEVEEERGESFSWK